MSDHECALKRSVDEAHQAGNPHARLGGPTGGVIDYRVKPSSIGATLEIACECGAVLEDVTGIWDL